MKARREGPRVDLDGSPLEFTGQPGISRIVCRLTVRFDLGKTQGLDDEEMRLGDGHAVRQLRWQSDQRGLKALADELDPRLLLREAGPQHGLNG